MTLEEAKMQIQAIPEKIWDQLSEPDREAMEMAFSALQAQEEKTQLSREDTTSGVQKTCITCKHYPPESKWPCIDCDMRNPADRWEPQELSKNSTKLDKENGDLQPNTQPTCNELAKDTNVPCKDTIRRQAAIDAAIKADMENNSNVLSEKRARVIDRHISAVPSAQPEPLVKESRTLVKDLVKDTISRQAAIDEIRKCRFVVDAIEKIRGLPSAQPERCEDAVSRNAIIQKLNTMDRYVSEELILCDTDKKFPKNEVFIVDDVYEEIVENLPSAQPESHWIPVSEKLPGENEFVLVTFGWFGRKTDPGVNIDEIRDGDWMISEVVTAWMPLPEPYRAERKTDEKKNI